VASERGLEVLIQRLDPDLPLPQRGSPGDAGWDLRSRVDVQLQPGERAQIPTGVAIALPAGFVGLVHPRSGLASRSGFTLVNSPGTSDAGYRGEISVIGLNTDRTAPIDIARGDRIAQLLVQEFATVEWREVQELPGSWRGEGGFGSTGIG
jgi:dUTP pyrophosphatase